METEVDVKINLKEINSTEVKCYEKPEEEVDIYIVIPPDGGWGWMVVMGAFFSFLITDGIIFAFGIFLNNMSNSFNCSKSQASLAGAIMTGIFCLTGPFTSAMVNRFGYRKVAILGSFIASLSCALTSISSSHYMTYLTHGILGGIGFGLINVPSIIAVGFYFERWRALATGISVCGSGVGGILLPPILELLSNRIGWRSTFQILTILSSFCAIFGLTYKPLKPTRIKSNTVPHKESEIEHVIAVDNQKSFFARFHNISHPTVADIHSKSRARVQDIPLQTPLQSEALSTVTIFMPKLNANTSSEFIMEETISSTSSTSKISFKSTKPNKMENSTYSTKVPDSRLSTVYEEAASDGCCRNICFDLRKIKPILFNRRNDKVDGFNIVRPLYRDDIFYSASIVLLPEYIKSIQRSESKVAATSVPSKSKPMLEYSMLVTRAITQKELYETKTCTLWSEAIKRTLATMLDFNLLKSPSFILLTCNAIFVSFGYYTPYMFIKDRAIQHGVNENLSYWLLSCMGATNTIGRIACGIITSLPRKSTLKLCYTTMITAGIATSVSGLSYNTWMQFGYAGLYGLSIAGASVLRTIIVVDLLGLEKLTNAIGLILLFQGAGCLIGTSVSGLLRDLTGDYEASFYFAGISIGIGSLFLIPVKKISKWERKQGAVKHKNLNINFLRRDNDNN